jgi:hypothetical protein
MKRITPEQRRAIDEGARADAVLDDDQLCSICGAPAVERFIDGHARCAGHMLGDPPEDLEPR